MLSVDSWRLNAGLRRWALPVATGVLMALAFPPFNVSQMGWFCLVPLLVAVAGCGPGEAFRRGYVAGLVFFALTIWWIVHVTIAGTVGLIAFLALYFGVGAVWFAVTATKLFPRDQERQAGVPAASADRAWRNIVASVIGSAGWVVVEWFRGKLLFGGFPWNYLGVSQWQVVPLIQFANVTGVYGVSLLVCFVNVSFYFTIRRFVRWRDARGQGYRLSWEFYLAMGLVGLALLHGVREIFHPEPESARMIRVALVQGDIPQTLKFDPGQKPLILERYRTLTEAAWEAHPDLIIWPETATPDALRYDPDSFGLVTNLAERSGAYLLTGTLDATPYSSPAEVFNAAILIGPDASVRGIYHKLHLVPFGEYVPLRRIFPFLKWLTPIGDSLERGHEYTVFEADAVRFSAVICFEDTVPELVRRFVQRHVDFMVNVTNDAWFKTSPAAEMHLANAIFRAVENHRPLVRAANNGITCVVNEYGSVNPKTRLTPFTKGMVVCDLRLPQDPEQTFYTLHGDWLVGVCLLVVGLAIVRSRKLILVGSRPRG